MGFVWFFVKRQIWEKRKALDQGDKNKGREKGDKGVRERGFGKFCPGEQKGR